MSTVTDDEEKASEPKPPVVDLKIKEKAKSASSYDVDEHLLSLNDLLVRMRVTVDPEEPQRGPGLSRKEAAARLEQDGPNRLTPPPQTPEWKKFLHKFTEIFMLMLLGAAVLSFVSYAVTPSETVNLYLGVVLVSIVTLNCLIAYLQERQSNQVMKSISSMLPSKCQCIREGCAERIEVSNLVRGDLVQLTLGDRVPADLRIISCNGLKVETSALTGESAPVPCTVESTHKLPHESKNLVFNSCLVVEGEGLGIVVRTGDDTFIGSIAALSSSTRAGRTTLQIEVARFVKFVAVLALSMASLFFVVGLLRGRSVMDTFIFVFITVLVANVPQGLPATVTSALAVAARRMQAANVFVKRLDSVETLGATTCICSDKTGTLTQNRMSVQNFWLSREYNMLNGQVVRAVVRRQASRSILRRETSGGSLRVATGAGAGAGAGAAAADTRGASDADTDTEEGKTIELSSIRLDASTAVTSAAASATAVSTTAPTSTTTTTTATTATTTTAARSSSAAAARAMAWRSWEANNLCDLLTVAGVCNDARFEATQHQPLRRASSILVSMMNVLSGLVRSNSSSHENMSEAVQRAGAWSAHPTTIPVMGNATDAALVRYCDRLMPIDELRRRYSVLGRLPFNSTNKIAYNLVRDTFSSADQLVGMLKGAPERVLALCDRYLLGTEAKPIDASFKQEMQDAYERFASQGQRVIGFALRTEPVREVADQLAFDDVSSGGFIFLGLVSLMDPPKEGVEQAIETCREAGISVFMVTGDHALTAEAIARRVAILTRPTRRDIAESRGVEEDEVPLDDPAIQARVVTGDELAHLKTNEEWDAIMRHQELVFARTSPQQKLDIVEHCRRVGHVVAVTGDGVNDSPALRAADIGVAMGGESASDVAREAADIVLMDDNFASIVVACTEGRVLFDNLKKTVAYTLAHLLPEILSVIVNLVFGMPLGMTSLQILAIDLGTEPAPAISLAFQPAESAVMLRPPRSIKTDRLVSPGLVFYSYLLIGSLEAAACFASYAWVFSHHGLSLSDIFNTSDYFVTDASPFVVGGRTFSKDEQMTILARAQAAWFCTLVLCQTFHVLLTRTRLASTLSIRLSANAVMVTGIIIEVLLAALITYAPPIATLFSTDSVSPLYLTPCLFFALFAFFFTEAIKGASRRIATGLSKPKSCDRALAKIAF